MQRSAHLFLVFSRLYNVFLFYWYVVFSYKRGFNLHVCSHLVYFAYVFLATSCYNEPLSISSQLFLSEKSETVLHFKMCCICEHCDTQYLDTLLLCKLPHESSVSCNNNLSSLELWYIITLAALSIARGALHNLPRITGMCAFCVHLAQIWRKKY